MELILCQLRLSVQYRINVRINEQNRYWFKVWELSTQLSLHQDCSHLAVTCENKKLCQKTGRKTEMGTGKTVANKRHEKEERQSKPSGEDSGVSKHKEVQRHLQWDNLCANTVMDRQNRTFLFSINTPTLLSSPTPLFISMSKENISALVKYNAQLGLWLKHRRLCLKID